MAFVDMCRVPGVPWLSCLPTVDTTRSTVSSSLSATHAEKARMSVREGVMKWDRDDTLTVMNVMCCYSDLARVPLKYY